MFARKHYFAIALAALVFATPVVGFSQNSGSQSHSRSAGIHHACADAMGLNPADAEYAACVSSLKQTLARPKNAGGTQRDREAAACAEVGLTPGTPAFQQCVLNLDQTEADETDEANR
ncbi:MAG TPA: hypothetical protein VKQ29_08410 [Aliidongia sp.]|nr:hypothetical protein [Aliidongia sp.]